MSTSPDRAEAARICTELMGAVAQLREELAARDPQGTTLSLGVTMFFGAFMSCVASKQHPDRDLMSEMCDAAKYYALTAREILGSSE
jgi:hypothetical protein